ncbi:unnamed protein product [Spirodela intermedia]|uniref:Uncharacterized protein n=1 Tax=Spirodela intermedia TaxID=51605 RepID=A0A7I8LI55_SPIIN|nr:unnamed protein product [Spirodela intermedia]
MMDPNPFIPDVPPPHGPFFDMLPPPEIMEQKLIIQHSEMQTLVHENRRLASSHVTLREDLATTQQELQRMHTQIGLMKAEKEQKMNGFQDKIMKMEDDLSASEGIKVELQKAHAEAQDLLSVREELISGVQRLTQDLRRVHAGIQQLPALMSELEGFKREYHDCRITYEHERKLYSDHLESLQVMEKNYLSMLREVEKLRTVLANSSSSDPRPGMVCGQYGTNAGYQESEAYAPSAPSQGQNAYEDVYNVHQVFRMIWLQPRREQHIDPARSDRCLHSSINR